MMEEAVQIARRFGQDRELAVALQTYATVLLGTGEAERAHAMVRESLGALRRDPSFLFIARAVDHHAQGHAAHDPVRAAREIGIATAIRRHIGANRFQHDEARMAGVIARLRETLGDDAFERALSDGARVPPATAIDEVLRDDEADATSPASAPAAVPDPSPAAPRAESAAAPAATASVPDLAVRTLGPFEVRVQGVRVDAWPYARPKELLAWLLVHPQGSTRAEIGAALWPDAAPSQVRNSFHVTMHHLRRALGHAEWIVTSGERYTIAPGVTVELDADVFRDRVQAALGMSGAAGITALTDAMRLYGGHFLAGETVASWRDDVQDRLRRMFCDAGMRLGALHEAAGDDDAAAAAYEAVAACEPLHEAAHRGLLLTLTRSGRRAHAVRHFERLRTLLRDLDLDPEEETIELYERIRGADIVPGPPA
jgi:DNA-binding SARP family transcriptional activator